MDRTQFQTRARFRFALRRQKIPDGATLLVAVSGGRDSMVLLDLTRREAERRGWHLWVVHVNHDLHAESGATANQVRDQARHWGLSSLGFRARSGLWNRKARSEENARRFRYAAFARAITRVDADFVLLGHHQQDQAETLLLRLFRGSGARGLAAMAERRGPYVRPLLEIGASEIRHWAHSEHLEFREDPTNRDPAFTRNQLRHQLWPELERFQGPNLARVLARTSAALRITAEHIDQEAARTWEALGPQIDTSSIRLDRPRLATYDRAIVEAVLRRASRKLLGTKRDLGRAPVAAVAAAVFANHPKNFHLPSGLRVFVNASEVRLVDCGDEKLSKGRLSASNRMQGKNPEKNRRN